MNNKSPLRYPGGKTRACKILIEKFEEYFTPSDFDTIISPFLGGGSFEFYFQNKYNTKIVGNDMFTPLFEFWNMCKENKTKLIEILKPRIGKITKAEFKMIQSRVMGEEDCLNQAADYFTLNRCSFSGSTLSGGYSGSASEQRFTPSSLERISLLNLQNCMFTNLDFEEFISLFYNNNTFMFLDPPYFLENTTLYGKNGNMHQAFEHKRLFKTLVGKKWMLTYNDCQYIRELYKDYLIIEASWSYGMNKSKKSSEIIILST